MAIDQGVTMAANREVIMSDIRVMHFLNQFFSGAGGEEQADMPVGFVKGTAGPGKRLQSLLGDTAEIAVSAYCGDNYFSENTKEALERILKIAKEHDIKMLAAGPAFASGRYGFACVEVCHSISTSLGLDCVTAMHGENPGVDSYQQYKDRKVFLFPTSDAVTGMGDALLKMAQCLKKLALGSTLGSAPEEGYIPRGLRVEDMVSDSGAKRAVDMLLNKVTGHHFVSEIPIDHIEAVPVAPQITNLARAHVALANTSGVVLKGNPDGFKAYKNTQWRKYSIDKLASMKDAKWDVVHGGHNTAFEQANPNYGVPLDACRELEKEGVFGRLYPFYYVVPGNQGIISVMQGIGREWVGDMKSKKIDAVLLVST
jgi:glycine reductase